MKKNLSTQEILKRTANKIISLEVKILSLQNLKDTLVESSELTTEKKRIISAGIKRLESRIIDLSIYYNKLSK